MKISYFHGGLVNTYTQINKFHKGLWVIIPKIYFNGVFLNHPHKIFVSSDMFSTLIMENLGYLARWPSILAIPLLLSPCSQQQQALYLCLDVVGFTLIHI